MKKTAYVALGKPFIMNIPLMNQVYKVMNSLFKLLTFFKEYYIKAWVVQKSFLQKISIC